MAAENSAHTAKKTQRVTIAKPFSRTDFGVTTRKSVPTTKKTQRVTIAKNSLLIPLEFYNLFYFPTLLLG
jgi:hypothetical protein